MVPWSSQDPFTGKMKMISGTPGKWESGQDIPNNHDSHGSNKMTIASVQAQHAPKDARINEIDPEKDFIL